MGLGVIRYKIWRDLWENKGRTLRVVLAVIASWFPANKAAQTSVRESLVYI